jgi:metallo-beta-lactamase class B
MLSLGMPGLTFTPQTPETWTARTPPSRVIDNIYYVGTVDLASYLITTPEGHILIDTGVAQNADAVADNIAALGFKVRDVRVILTTQAHYDHVGAHAKLMAASGARVLVSAADAPLVEGGGKGDYLFGPDYYFPPAKVDGVIADGDTVRLGGTELVAHLTPGHTKGCTTWTMKARDLDGTPRTVVFAGSTTVNPGTKLVANKVYPTIAEDYQRSFRTLKALPCEIFLAAHASVFAGPDKLAKARAGAKSNPFLDSAGYQEWVARSERTFLAELEKQRKESANAAPATVAFKAPDGISLKGTYYSPGKPGPAVLLLHQCNRDRSAWTPLAAEAASRGFHVLALDFRGYGESEGTRFKTFQEQQPTIEQKWPGDVDAALAWLVAQDGVDRSRVGVAGASCGVSQSILAARRHPEIRTVVLLSGGATSEGRDYLRQATAMPVFAAASRGDGDAVNTMRWVLGWSRNPANKFAEFKAAGHGTDMLAVEKGLQPAILDWFDSYVRNPPAAAPAPAGEPAKPSAIEEFWTLLTSPGGLDRAYQLYDVERRRNPRGVLFPESEMNAYGYRRLQGGHPEEAVAIFSMNADAYPRSANTYDSLADAYLAAGKRPEALAAAQKALKVLKDDKSLTLELRELVRESIEKKIRELQ